MKKTLTLLILFLNLTAFAQSLGSLQTATKKLYEANYLMVFEDIQSLSYPTMVETIGKETMITQLEKYYENEDYRLREQLETVPFLIGKTQTINGKSFCLITFRNPVRYFFEAKLTDAQAVEKKAWLQETTKSKDVTFEPKRNSFNVKRQSTYVAVMDENTMGDWKFFNMDDANQLAIFQRLFGDSVKKQLGL